MIFTIHNTTILHTCCNASTIACNRYRCFVYAVGNCSIINASYKTAPIHSGVYVSVICAIGNGAAV